MLKGLYDHYGKAQKILVTGSARLDYYRHSGDSLQGRYHYLRLLPLSVAELQDASAQTFDQLLRLGGFPEPFEVGEETFAKRWSREYRSRLIREEISSLESISDLGKLEHLMLRLPDLVGSPLSINAPREDLQVSFKLAAKWIEILERFYAIFRVPPFGSPKVKAVKKEQKHFHMDWTLVEEMGARFENLVAVHLLKWVFEQQDCWGEDLDLRYFRDEEGREVDFVIVKKRAPILFVECKWGQREFSPHLKYLSRKFPGVRAVQVHAQKSLEFMNDEGLEMLSAQTFLAELV